jgi:hypothetical protein
MVLDSWTDNDGYHRMKLSHPLLKTDYTFCAEDYCVSCTKVEDNNESRNMIKEQQTAEVLNMCHHSLYEDAAKSARRRMDSTTDTALVLRICRPTHIHQGRKLRRQGRHCCQRRKHRHQRRCQDHRRKEVRSYLLSSFVLGTVGLAAHRPRANRGYILCSSRCAPYRSKQNERVF